jgi:Glycosyl transferase family 2
VTIAMTLVVRDEVDVIDTHLAFHLAGGIDLVLVTDHRSEDGTSEILAQYERAGRVRVFREEGERTRQGEWVTRMARLAATDHGADWVLHSDADEFWWPRGESLAEVLAGVPDRYGVVEGVQRSFLPVEDDGSPFWERMTVRLAPGAAINDPGTPYRPVGKIAHRGDPSVVVHHGNHTVRTTRSRCPARPLELGHFPLRSRAQCARKYGKTWEAWDENLRGDLARAQSMSTEGRAEDYYDRVALDCELVARGLAQGVLVADTRLRDAVRLVPERPPGATHPRPTAAERRSLALDAVILDEATLVRLQREVDAIDVSLAAREWRRGRGRVGA